MRDYTQYRRTQIAEMADWAEGFDMTDVSISPADLKAGSPKTGDKIARNPANHEDRWLVAADYFAANFEPLAPPSPPEPKEITEALEHADLLEVCEQDPQSRELDLNEKRIAALARAYRAALPTPDSGKGEG